MEILKVFQYHQKLKFSDIEKALNTRSNKLAYHLKNLTKKGLLTKERNFYSLSETSEYMIPYLSEKKAIVPVILIKIGNTKECFLYHRKKRPFKDQLSLPGGRPLLGESIADTVKRIMAEKFSINAKLRQIHSISVENLRKQGKTIQTDIILFVSAATKDKITLANLEKNKSRIITSDYWLIKNDSGKKLSIKTINTTKI